jgi:predicted Rossmann fold nucleotide-binding protein DprA/Smf involved in DNA uptake
VIIVQAHRLSTTRLLREWQKAIGAGRLLLLSPFADKDRRVTAELAAKRNCFVAAISDEVLIPYAAPGSKTEALALELLTKGKSVYTFHADPNSKLIERGAVAVSPELLCTHCKSAAARSLV